MNARRESEEEAVKAWHRLLGGPDGEPPPVSPPPQPRPPKPKREPLAGKAPPTVREVVEAFLADIEGRVKENTVRVYGVFFTPFLAKYGTTFAEEFAPTTAEAYARQQGWADSTQATFLGALISAFRFAVRARLLEHTPLEGLRCPPRTSRGEETLLTAEEHARLLDNATPAFRLVLRVLWAVGCRPGEATAITAENFDEVNGLVRLREHKTAKKTGKGRTLYLTPEVVALLAEQRERYPSGALLRNNHGNAWTPRALVKAMDDTRKRAGVPHAICYGLRHTFATDALANGVPDAQVAELLGHAGTAMLHRHYSHLMARHEVLRSALGKVRA
jgi:integrase